MWNMQHGPEHSRYDAQDNGICEDIFQGTQEQCLGTGFFAVLRRSQGKGNDGNDVIQGNGSHDHECRHGSFAVNIIDKGYAQDRRTAPVGCLDNLTPFHLVLMEQGKEHGNNNAAYRSEKAELHKFCVPDCLEIRRGQVHEQQCR